MNPGFFSLRPYNAAKGLELVPLPTYRPPGASYHAATSYQVMDWLVSQQRPFDVVGRRCKLTLA